MASRAQRDTGAALGLGSEIGVQIIVDPALCVVQLTQSAASLLGHDPDQLLGRSLAILSPDAHSPLRQAALRILAGIEPGPIEGSDLIVLGSGDQVRLAFRAAGRGREGGGLELTLAPAQSPPPVESVPKQTLSVESASARQASVITAGLNRLSAELPLCGNLTEALTLIRSAGSDLSIGVGGQVLARRPSAGLIEPIGDWGNFPMSARIHQALVKDVWSMRTGEPHAWTPENPGMPCFLQADLSLPHATAPLISRGEASGLIYIVFDAGTEKSAAQQAAAAMTDACEHVLAEMIQTKAQAETSTDRPTPGELADVIARASAHGETLSLLLVTYSSDHDIAYTEAIVLPLVGELLNPSDRLIRIEPGLTAAILLGSGQFTALRRAKQILTAAKELDEPSLQAWIGSASLGGAAEDADSLLTAAEKALDSAKLAGPGKAVSAERS
jgi:hypothetical protein